MKVSIRNVCIVLTILIGVTTLSSCDKAQRDVAAQNVMDKIDNALGEYSVRLQRVENSHEALVKARNELIAAATKAEVQSERIAETLAETKSKVDSLKKIGSRLVGLIQEGSFPATMGKATFETKEDAAAAAREVAERVKLAEAQLATQQQVHDMYSKTNTQMSAQVKAAGRKLNEMASDIALAKIKIEALEAQREAAKTAGLAGSSLAEEFDTLQSDLDDLFVDAETEIRVEQDKWEQMRDQMSDSDDLLDQMMAPEDDIAELESLFGGS